MAGAIAKSLAGVRSPPLPACAELGSEEKIRGKAVDTREDAMWAVFATRCEGGVVGRGTRDDSSNVWCAAHQPIAD